MSDKEHSGIVTDLCSSQYHAIKRNAEGHLYCSKSTLWKFKKDQQAWKLDPHVEVSTAMKLGSFLDACLLDPDEKANFYKKEDNPHLTKRKDGVLVCASKEAKAWAKEREEQGHHPISDSEHYEVAQNVLHIQNDPTSVELMRDMMPQVAIFTELEGIPFKCLLDITPSKNGPFGNGLADLKRTQKFLPHEFRYHLQAMGYHWQAAIYLDAWNQEQQLLADNDPEYEPDFRDKWYFLISNSQKPYGCGVAELSTELIEKGREEYKEAIPLWKNAIETNTFKNPYQLPVEILTL